MTLGIHPDVVIALEAQAANLGDFIPGFAEDSMLACDLSSHPVAARLAAGRLSFFSSAFAPLRIFGRMEAAGLRPEPIPALGSVGVAGLHAALQLTRGEIYLAGLDFAFSEGRTHARGSPPHLQMLTHSARLSPVGLDAYRAMSARQLVRSISKNGTTVRTDAVLHSYRDSLEVEAQESKGRVIDCGAWGLDLGVTKMSVPELEERLAAGKSSENRLHKDPARRFQVGRLRTFLASERTLLERFITATAGNLSRGAPFTDDLRQLLLDVDYAWIHFPDEPDFASPGPGFLARARVAAAYYGQRIQRAASVI
jgi:hypothetical protein